MIFSRDVKTGPKDAKEKYKEFVGFVNWIPQNARNKIANLKPTNADERASTKCVKKNEFIVLQGTKLHLALWNFSR